MRAAVLLPRPASSLSLVDPPEDSEFRTYSTISDRAGCQNSVLDEPGSWCPTSTTDEWMQVDVGSSLDVAGLLVDVGGVSSGVIRVFTKTADSKHVDDMVRRPGTRD
jgi:hypothetical protein